MKTSLVAMLVALVLGCTGSAKASTTVCYQVRANVAGSTYSGVRATYQSAEYLAALFARHDATNITITQRYC